MKNIYLLPTNEPSRLFKDDFGKLLYSINIDQEQKHFQPLNIYITSDEEIKEVDWIYKRKGIYETIQKATFPLNLTSVNKKIILTTDSKLIVDGVQSIDDKFLQWFVKNPSCQEVEVDYDLIITQDKPLLQHQDSKPIIIPHKIKYKIIIPKKEQPKQVWEQIIDTCGGKENFMKLAGLLPKKEIIIEAAEKFYSEQSESYENETDPTFDNSRYLVAGFIDGVKSDVARDYWFEQFKKK